MTVFTGISVHIQTDAHMPCCFTDKCSCALSHILQQRLSQLVTLHAALEEQDQCPAALLLKNGFLAVGPLHARLAKGLSTSSWLLLRTDPPSQT